MLLDRKRGISSVTLAIDMGVYNFICFPSILPPPNLCDLKNGANHFTNIHGQNVVFLSINYVC